MLIKIACDQGLKNHRLLMCWLPAFRGRIMVTSTGSVLL